MNYISEEKYNQLNSGKIQENEGATLIEGAYIKKEEIFLYLFL